MGVEILYPIINRATAPIKSVNIDDLSSQLNRTFMFYLSLVFAVTITIRQQLGGAVIACDGFQRDEDYERFAEDWCWSSGIYTIKEAYEMRDRASPYPGIVPEDLPACVEFELKSGGRIECPDEKDVKPLTRIYQTWYPFVMFYYWMTALMFFLPYQLYKLFGFDKVKAVVSMLQNPVEDGFEKKEMIKRGSVWLYLQSTMSLSHQSLYSSFVVKHSLAFYALLVKIMFLGNTILMFWLTHKMFKFGSFAEYGLLWEMNTPVDNVNSLIQEKLFPKVAACEVKRFGASGMDEDQGMCMLALNILNQYLFLAFWFCLIIVTIINCFSLLLTLINILFPSLMLKQFLVSSSLDRSPAVGVISKLYLDSGSSMRFMMDIFARNVDPKLFGEILVQLYSLLGDDKKTEGVQVFHRRPQKQKVNKLSKSKVDNKLGKFLPKIVAQKKKPTNINTKVTRFNRTVEELKEQKLTMKSKQCLRQEIVTDEVRELEKETDCLLPSNQVDISDLTNIKTRDLTNIKSRDLTNIKSRDLTNITSRDEDGMSEPQNTTCASEGEVTDTEDEQQVIGDPLVITHDIDSDDKVEVMSEEPLQIREELEITDEEDLEEPDITEEYFESSSTVKRADIDPSESGEEGDMKSTLPLQIPVVMLNDDVLSLRSVNL